MCPDPIFVIGSPRSGTMILARALAEHSHLWASEETGVLTDLYGSGKVDDVFRAATGPAIPSWLVAQGMDREEFLRHLGTGINALFSSRSGGKRWIDQNPAYVSMAGVLAGMFPGASFLHVLRDGRRVVSSRMSFAWPPQPNVEFRDVCREWEHAVTLGMQLASRYPERCLTVRNEELVAAPHEGFETISRFLRMPSEAEPEGFFRSAWLNTSFGECSNRPPSDHDLSQIWNTWTLDQKVVFLEEAGDAMLRQGFIGDEEMRRMEEDAGQTPGLSDLWKSWTPEQKRAFLEAEDEPDDVEYFLYLRQIREVVDRELPADASVLVISEGDEGLLWLSGRSSSHFPRGESGGYAGCVADGVEAIWHLRALRAAGADYLLVPWSASWWLEEFPEFREHLEELGRLIWSDDACVIYELTGRPTVPYANN